jgi:uncharacterized protein (TIGR00369 family)
MSDNPVLTRQVPLLDTLSIDALEASEGKSRLRVQIADRHLRTLNMLHGGVTATLLDTALGYAVMSLAAEGFHAVTVQLNVNFTRPAMKGDKLEAVGRVLHAGTQTAVASGEVTNADGQLIATATGTFLYLRLPE